MSMSRLTRSERWRFIWSRRFDAWLLEPLHIIDGFEKMDESEWKIFVDEWIDRVRITHDSSVLDVGCGGGAWLQHLRFVKNIIGVDYTVSAVTVAELQTKAHIVLANADSLPFKSNSFDVVIAWSILQYANSVHHADKIIEELVRVTCYGGRVLLGDINDAAKRIQSEIWRAKHRPKGPGDPGHTFLNRQHLVKISRDLNCALSFHEFDRSTTYPQAQWRFSLILEKTPIIDLNVKELSH